MVASFPIKYNLHDGTHVEVYKIEDECFEFLMTRLNSEKHNFYLKKGRIEESYETRFDELQHEAVETFTNMYSEATQ